VRELDEHQLVLAFWSPLAHKGRGNRRQRRRRRARRDVSAPARHLLRRGAQRVIGRSTVVAPGRLADGCYAIADLHTQDVELATMSVPA